MRDGDGQGAPLLQLGEAEGPAEDPQGRRRRHGCDAKTERMYNVDYNVEVLRFGRLFVCTSSKAIAMCSNFRESVSSLPAALLG